MAEWMRSRMNLSGATYGDVHLGQIRPTITLRADTTTGKLRLGLWVADLRVGGWTVPLLPANLLFTIDRGRASALVDGEVRSFPSRLLAWDGVFPSSDHRLPDGPFSLTLDQEVGKVVPVLVDVQVEAVEGG